MFKKSKFALVAAVAVMGIASPAFAQSVDHTGTLFASHYDGTGKQVVGSWASPSTGSRTAVPQAVANRYEQAVQGRDLYATTVVPSVSGYDPSIASQR